MDAPRARGVPPTPARAVAALALACCCGLLRAAVPVPTPAQLRLAQRGYGSPSTGAVPTMGSPLLPGLTMFQHFGPCTFAKRPLTRGLLSASVLRHAYLIFLKPMVTA